MCSRQIRGIWHQACNWVFVGSVQHRRSSTPRLWHGAGLPLTREIRHSRENFSLSELTGTRGGSDARIIPGSSARGVRLAGHRLCTPRLNVARKFRISSSDAERRSPSAVKRQPPITTAGQTRLLLAAGCFISRRRAQLAPERAMAPGYVEYASRGEDGSRSARPRSKSRQTEVDGSTPPMMAVMHG